MCCHKQVAAHGTGNNMIRKIIVLLCAVLALQPVVLLAQSSAQESGRYYARHHPQLDASGMVASDEIVASWIGAAILARGGNAIDAAVAVGFALAVTKPSAGNIGGGGLMLVYLAESNESVAIDYREQAPPRATRDMFLDAGGNADAQESRYGYLASGVPGTVAGLWLAHQKYGRLPWETVVMPAVELARNGITVSYYLAQSLAEHREHLASNAASRQYFYKDGGEPYQPGEQLVQSDLANSLQQIALEGPDAFYKGDIAAKIAAEMNANGGLVDKAALASYQPVIREVLTGTYRGFEIVAMPPPSSGGIHIIQMLNILEQFPVAEFGPGSADNVHLLAEVMRLAFADRSKHLGDPDFYAVPTDWLTSKAYARELAANIDIRKARPSSEVAPGTAAVTESVNTTHFSIMDADGNAVANTYTLNLSYGSGISVPGAGFLLNDEMDDFVSKPGEPNAFGLLGGAANAIAPHKRPLSSMSPTMVFRDGKPFLITGSPGGSHIITAVLQMLVNVMDHGMNIADAASVPRMHHQWYPDILQLESGFSPDTVRELERRGHDVRFAEAWSSLQSVSRKDGVYRGWSDPRASAAGSAGPSAVAN
jgi:gamma-glutamyltranspeptidase / glutathione hydrolase